jgi:pimeloyl-[acyl-carrier protein] methyl ester esterase
MRTFEAHNGGQIAYSDRGEGPPVVLLHGWSLASGVFDSLGAALSRSRRVVAPDLRGHGGSRAAPPFGLDALVTDLEALLVGLDLQGVALLGWSLGAEVVLAALERPEVRARVDRLVLVGATPRFTTGEGWPHGVPARTVEVIAQRVRRDPARAFARFFRDLFAAGELDAGAATGAEALRAALPAPDPAAALAGLEILTTADLRGSLAAVELPTLVLHGAADPICPASAGQALAAAIPGARVVLFPGAGHAPFLSCPGPFLEALSAFLGADR